MVPIHAKKRKWVNSRALPDLAGSATWRLYTEQPWMSYRAPSLDENDSFRPRPPVGCVVAVALHRFRQNGRSAGEVLPADRSVRAGDRVGSADLARRHEGGVRPELQRHHERQEAVQPLDRGLRRQ